MAKFRKKPVVIEAYQFHNRVGTDARPDWLLAAVSEGVVKFVDWQQGNPDHLEITTLEGVMRADVDDWIIKGIKGEFYPCKNDVFEQSYERVEE